MVGLGPLLYSIFNNSRTPQCIHAHILQLPGLEAQTADFHRAAVRQGHTVTLHTIDQDKHKLLRNCSSSSTLNLARFYFTSILPATVDKVLWLDADVIVRCDVHQLLARLFVGRRRSRPIAAVARNVSFVRLYGQLNPVGTANFLKVERVRELNLKESWGYDLNSIKQGEAFNAGVTAFNLVRWREDHLSKRLEALEPALLRLGLATYKGLSVPNHGGRAVVAGSKFMRPPSSQLPLSVLFGHNFQHMDPSWNVEGLGWRKGLKRHVLRSACALHWSGPGKPWGNTRVPGDHSTDHTRVNPYARQWYTPALVGWHKALETES